jgi:phosphonate transport system ATP-binding protein
MDRSTKQPAAVRASALTKSYPGGVLAVDQLSCEIAQDEFVVVLGPSGAGKSTFLRCINRLIEPTDGRIELNGEDVTHVSGRALQRVRGRVGMIFQQFHLSPRLTVLENVLAGRLRFARTPWRVLASILRRFPRSEREIAFGCLEGVGIADLAFKRADALSGGQQQRVAIARALAQEPELILADEPVASLDPASARLVMDTLARIHQTQGIPVVVNLHQVDLGREYGQRILGMAQGRIVFDGNPLAFDRATTERLYGSPATPAPAKTNASLPAGLPSLETVEA